MKLVDLSRNIDFAKDKDFFTSLLGILFQFALRVFFFDFEVRFLGTAIFNLIGFFFLQINCINRLDFCQYLLTLMEMIEYV